MVDDTGATGFIRKTPDPARLVGEVRRWLEQGRPIVDDPRQRFRETPHRHPLAP